MKEDELGVVVVVLHSVGEYEEEEEERERLLLYLFLGRYFLLLNFSVSLVLGLMLWNRGSYIQVRKGQRNR